MPGQGSSNVPRIVDVRTQMRNDNERWRAMFAALMVFALVMMQLARGSAPEPYAIAIVLFVCVCGAAFVRPTVGVYLLTFCTLIGDTVTMDWWPFDKNMSSRESIMFVNDQLFLTPMEVLAGVTLASWLLRRLVDPTWKFQVGRLLWPVAILTVFVMWGLVWGKATGGDTRAAIFEARPLLYLPIMYVLVTNILTTRRQYRVLVVLAFVAVAIQSIFSLLYYRGLSTNARETLESLSEHSATVHMNALFIFGLSVAMLRCRPQLRWLMALLALPVVYAYLLSQRRAAMVSFFVGVFVLLVVLFYRRRRAFWFVTPLLAVLTTVLVVGTWNAGGAIGLPAQAVKTVLFPGSLAEEDRGSDLYREVEKYDLSFTIHAKPVTGLGFGHKFFTPIALPDISFFEFWQYLPHNAVLWVWIKLGFFGFATMFFLFGRAMQLGVRSALAVRSDEDAAVVVTGLTYTIMFIVFAYVDIVWNARSTVFLAIALAICADMLWADEDRPRRDTGVHRRQLESIQA